MNIIKYIISGIAAFILILVAVNDVKNREINIFCVVGLLICGICHAFASGMSATDMILGAVPGLTGIAVSLSSRGKLGLGDALLFVAIGTGAGIEKMTGVVLFAFASSALVGVVLIILKKANGKTEIPFAPFILGGCLFTVGGELIEML